MRKLYCCRECARQYTATVGTVFQDSKIPLSKWFAAIYMMCTSHEGLNAHQIHREMGITYKSARFMCHRLRDAQHALPMRPSDDRRKPSVAGKKSREDTTTRINLDFDEAIKLLSRLRERHEGRSRNARSRRGASRVRGRDARQLAEGRRSGINLPLASSGPFMCKVADSLRHYG